MSATPLSIYFMLVDLRDLPLQVTYGITEKEFVVVFLVKSEPKPCLDKTSSTENPAGAAGCDAC